MLSVNTGIIHAILAVKLVTLQTQAKANLKRWKSWHRLRSVLPKIQLICSLFHCTIWAQASMELKYQLNQVDPSIILQEGTYKKHFKYTPLMLSSTRLHTLYMYYTGHPVKVYGKVNVLLKYQEQCADVWLLVVDSSGPSLFGRDWLSRIKLDWKKTCNICVSDTDLPLSVEQGCLMWGLQTVIPPSLRQPILIQQHVAHPGIVCMKSIARSHVWWSGIDREIDRITWKCQSCHKTHKAPPASPLFPWSWPTSPWQCICTDFATQQSRHYLIMVNTHSKWSKVISPMKTMTADSTINTMHNSFVRYMYGLPTQIISDGGPPFPSAEYKNSCDKMAFIEF